LNRITYTKRPNPFKDIVNLAKISEGTKIIKTKMMRIPIVQHTTYSAYLSEADTPIMKYIRQYYLSLGYMGSWEGLKSGIHYALALSLIHWPAPV